MNLKDLKNRIAALEEKIKRLSAHLIVHKKDAGVVRAIKKAASIKRKLESQLKIAEKTKQKDVE